MYDIKRTLIIFIEILFERKIMNKKSIAWKFFDISTTPHMSKCKLCDSLVTRGGKSLRSYGTTATHVLVKHLRLKHSKKFELAGKKKVQSFPSISETSVAARAVPWAGLAGPRPEAPKLGGRKF